MEEFVNLQPYVHHLWEIPGEKAGMSSNVDLLFPRLIL
jgi:hypothetical protein